MKNILINAAVALVSAFVGVALYSSFFDAPRQAEHPFQEAFELPYRHVAGNAMASDPLSLNFVEAAKRTKAAVVHIEALDFYSTDELFGDNTQNEIKDVLDGSGVIVSPDGYIVTTAHVVQNADKIEVSLTNKQKHEAEIVGIDYATDIALLRVRTSKLPFIRFGDSDGIEVGQWVLAVGNPFNLSSTVTAGIVSAKARVLDFTGPNNSLETYIQTDAAVNQGSSGGALINTKGELIGINSVIATTSGRFQGYSFAIPSNVIYKITQDIRLYGYVRKGNLGIDMRNLDVKKDREVNGVYVTGIQDNSPASRTDIRVGDIIKYINGFQVTDMAQLQNRLMQQKIGNAISLSIVRKNKSLIRQITLADDAQVVDIPANKIEVKLGATFEVPTETILESSFLSYGIQVVNLVDGLLQKKTGIKENFIIYQVNKKPVKDLEAFYNIIQTLKTGESISFKGRYPNTKKDRLFAFGL